jgi:hypothetical protein
LWPRLTFYRTWKDEYGHRGLDESGLITFRDEKSVTGQMTDYAGVGIL